MSEPTPREPAAGPPDSPSTAAKRPPISLARIALWIGVGGFGVYLIVTGLVGMIVKGQ